MKSVTVEDTAPDRPTAQRRQLLLGAGVAGAAALASQALPVAPEPGAAAQPRAAPEKGGGYQLSQHVLRYYETTRV